MSQQAERDRLVEIRRDLHRHPEPAWREFYTTARIVEELERIGVDDVYVGPDAIAEDERMAVPDDDELDEWYEQAREAGADPETLAKLEGGYTGAVAVLERGEGPTVGLRVDIDGLLRAESTDDDHAPVAEGFRSEHDGAMHACGHDAHATIGLGVVESVKDSDFEGTLKVFFQPGEEMIAGGKSMAESDHLADVDYLLAAHVGLDHPTGEIVAGLDGFLAVSHFRAEFEGVPAHAGGEPNAGENAVQAMATAVQNLYAIPRHEDGATRVNAGQVGGGTATNIIPEEAFVEGEVRGETTELKDYMKERARRVLESAAEMHGCEVDITTNGEAPSAESDDELVGVVADVAGGTGGVENVVERDELGGSEDATYLMRAVQRNGGKAAYVGVGTDHPGGHHTATFDVDEESIPVGIDVLAGAIRDIASKRP
ncbi:amidohydrolase [Halorussus sp. MSC15.2]|uniref:amidohydrolase n=1 Tax=Halorussus sp. MSC15.2 TaxID=2283638 RepID=UPI0013D56288|nr:amidohydrolase [Halorussus sp. MSC15.2]NEU57558.1 M20 family metallo-hydrolase [Halorussus sp. MSC15.2]